MAKKSSGNIGINPKLYKEISDGKNLKSLNDKIRKDINEKKEAERKKQLLKRNGNLEIQTPKVLGITGGIGAGKTLLMKHLKTQKIPIYISDLHAKKIASSEAVLFKIKQTWGLKVLTEGVVDKKKLSNIVFEDKSQMKKLNSIIHPLVKNHWEKWLLSKKKHRWVAKESAILLEVGGRNYCDIVINVVAPLATRVERIMKRDKLDSASDAILKINAQWNDKKRNEKSDYIIQNNSKVYAISQLNDILEKIIIS
jgi:dephospho-CoA kinase